tara:strand:- start:166 stop:651 length:486 start_codon:yes stop_codon:yes gene_type:complete
MKHLLILLFIPILSYSQISYEDVMSIKSVDIFKKVMIENGYEFDTLDTDGYLSYGFNLTKDSTGNSQSSRWMIYNINDDSFIMMFPRKNWITNFYDPKLESSKNNYDSIVKDIQEKCKYYKITNFKGTDYVTYSCSESSYKGKIGFVVSDGNGYIQHFPND